MSHLPIHGLLPSKTLRSGISYGGVRVLGFDFSKLSHSPSSADVDDPVAEAVVAQVIETVDEHYPPPFIPHIDPIDQDTPAPITSLLEAPAPRRHISKNGSAMFKRRQRQLKQRTQEIVERSEPQVVDIDTDELAHQITSYRGIPRRSGAANAIPSLIGDGAARLARLRSLGYFYIPSPIGYDIPLVDCKGVVFGLVVGMASLWKFKTYEVFMASQNLRDGCLKLGVSSRGDFACIAIGFSHGGGQKQPTPFHHTSLTNMQAAAAFLATSSVDSFTKYLEGPFKTWFPHIFQLYTDTLVATTTHLPHLRRPLKHLPFSGVTVNLGRQTCCRSHRDAGNFAGGPCLVCPLGDFDPTLGGHLILHEPKLILELAPGACVFFPSACITHENIPIREHETRNSFTGYMAGSILQWIDQGFKTQSHPSFEKVTRLEQSRLGQLRWEQTWSLFSNLKDLVGR